jgi:hypothetical protein
MIESLLRLFRSFEKEQVKELGVLFEFKPQTHVSNKFCKEVLVV